MKDKRIALYCSCGGAWEVNSDMPARAALAMKGMWLETHSGNGHEPASKGAARAERIRQEGLLSEAVD